MNKFLWAGAPFCFPPMMAVALNLPSIAEARDAGDRGADREQERVDSRGTRVDGDARDTVRDAGEKVGDEVRDELEDEADEAREELKNELD